MPFDISDALIWLPLVPTAAIFSRFYIVPAQSIFTFSLPVMVGLLFHTPRCRLPINVSNCWHGYISDISFIILIINPFFFLMVPASIYFDFRMIMTRRETASGIGVFCVASCYVVFALIYVFSGYKAAWKATS